MTNLKNIKKIKEQKTSIGDEPDKKIHISIKKCATFIHIKNHSHLKHIKMI